MSCTQEIIGSKDVDHSARWLATIHFKNSINRHWRLRPGQGYESSLWPAASCPLVQAGQLSAARFLDMTQRHQRSGKEPLENKVIVLDRPGGQSGVSDSSTAGTHRSCVTDCHEDYYSFMMAHDRMFCVSSDCCTSGSGLCKGCSHRLPSPVAIYLRRSHCANAEWQHSDSPQSLPSPAPYLEGALLEAPHIRPEKFRRCERFC